MTKRVRQIYLIVILLISIVLLPLILLYNSGFNVNWQNWSLVRTGSLAVSTIPNGATVTLQETKRSYTAPALINRLVPQTYTATISKPDYADWDTSVTIQANYSVVLDHIVLFHKQPATQSLTQYPTTAINLPASVPIKNLAPQLQNTISKLGLSNKYRIAENKNLITVLDSTGGKLFLLANSANTTSATLLDSEVVNYAWNSDNSQLLFFTPYEIKVYDYATKQVHLILRQSSPITEAIWHPSNHNIIFVSQQQVEVIETRVTDQPNIFVLYTGKSPHNVRTNKTGDQLYFTDRSRVVQLTIM